MFDLKNAQVVPLKRPLVIYHGNCADGFSAAWCFHHSQEEAQISYDFHPGIYGEELPDVEDRIVYLVDFSYKADKVAQILELCNGLYFIDHHKTALEDLKQFEDHPKFIAYTDLDRSGAMLAWDFLYNTRWEYPAHIGDARCTTCKPDIVVDLKPATFGYIPAPLLLEHVQDRDLWKFKLEGTKPISLSMMSHEMTFENWDIMMLGGFQSKTELWKEGAAIERKHTKDIKEFVEIGERFIVINGYNVPVCNVPYMWASDVGHLLLERHATAAFSATYYDTAEERIFSLRSQDHRVDVSKIAALFGGGGHRNAAGFKVKDIHWIEL